MADTPDPRPTSARLSPTGVAFVVGWAVGIVVLVTIAGWLSVAASARSRRDAQARHQARVDPDGVEPGRTAADAPPDLARAVDEVEVGLYLDRIPELSVHDGFWTADFYLWFRWRGDLESPGEKFQLIDGEVESRERLKASRDGDLNYELWRVSARVTKPFDASRFPCDDHLLTIQVEDGFRPAGALRYVADREGSAVSSRVRLSAYEIYDSKVLVKPHAYRTGRGDPGVPAGAKETYSQFVSAVWIRRPGFGFFFKLFQGLYAAVLIALLALFVRPTHVDPRFGLGVGAFFASVANQYITTSFVPDTGIATLTDLVNGVGSATIFLTLVQSAISLRIYESLENPPLSRLFDRVSVAVIAAGYLVINVAIPVAASV